MNSNPIPSFGSPAPGDDNNFKRKLINSIIGSLMVLSAVADHYHWEDLLFGIDRAKWLMDLIALFI